ncbi:MAG: RsiW-degrading membrane proteinase PrsW (M82 family) [Myxococcota bacterium]|jgi:RsiW-degrading membrane proteinase PrsW (M82 family)
MIWLLLALSVVASVAPMGLFIAVIWWLDRYDREPIWLMALTFLWGAVGSITVALMVSGVATIAVLVVAPASADLIGAAVIAPLVEEPSKALVLLPLLLSRHFDNTTDGFVYGATAGLGFAMTENFLYFASTGLSGDPTFWMQTVVVRTLYTGVMHASATAVVGACIGFAHFRGPVVLVIGAVIGLAGGIGIHSLWNGLLTLDAVRATGSAGFMVNLVVFPIEVLFVFVMFQFCLWTEKRVIHRELLLEASDEGTLPAEHAVILSSWFKRSVSKTWLQTSTPHSAYIRTATTLAMRRHQATLLGDRRNGAFYRERVRVLRAELASYREA